MIGPVENLFTGSEYCTDTVSTSVVRFRSVRQSKIPKPSWKNKTVVRELRSLVHQEVTKGLSTVSYVCDFLRSKKKVDRTDPGGSDRCLVRVTTGDPHWEQVDLKRLVERTLTPLSVP